MSELRAQPANSQAPLVFRLDDNRLATASSPTGISLLELLASILGQKGDAVPRVEGASIVVTVQINFPSHSSTSPPGEPTTAIPAARPMPAPAPRHLEDIQEAACRIIELRHFLLLPWALQKQAAQSGKTSVNRAVKHFHEVEKLGVDVSTNPPTHQEHREKVKELLRIAWAAHELPDLILRDGCSTPKAKNRQIIGLTEAGWRAWHEVRAFLEKHDPDYTRYAHLIATIRPCPGRAVTTPLIEGD
jgi:hypothetical protein